MIEFPETHASEFSSWLDLLELSNAALKRDLQTVLASHAKSSLELAPSLPESEGVLSWSEERLREAASQDRADLERAIAEGPALVETEPTVQKISDSADDLLRHLRGKIGEDAALLEQHRDELRILTPAMAIVAENARDFDSVLAEQLVACADSLETVRSVAASLSAQEEALRREEALISQLERAFGLAQFSFKENAGQTVICASSVALASQSQQSQQSLTLSQAAMGNSQFPHWPQNLYKAISAAETDARQIASSHCAAQLACLRADAEAQLAAVRLVGEQRVREAALEAETLLGAEFDASMSLHQSRMQSAQSQRAKLDARLSSIAAELDAQRRLRLLKAQTRRLWASMQSAKLSLALDCDSEGWASDNDPAGASSVISNDILHLEKIRQEKTAADEEHAHSLQLVSAEERRLKRQRASPLVSLGIFSSSSNASSTPKILPRRTRTDNLLPLGKDLSSAEQREAQTIAHLVELTPAASSAASAAHRALAASKKLAEAEARAAQHKLRRERRACARELNRAQNSRRNAADVLARDFADAVMEGASPSCHITKNSASVTLNLIDVDNRRKDWRSSILHLDREQRMRVAVCRFLSDALREAPYNAQFAIVLSVAKRVGDRLRGGTCAESSNRGTPSLLGVIAKIVGEAGGVSGVS